MRTRTEQIIEQRLAFSAVFGYQASSLYSRVAFGFPIGLFAGEVKYNITWCNTGSSLPSVRDCQDL